MKKLLLLSKLSLLLLSTAAYAQSTVDSVTAQLAAQGFTVREVKTLADGTIKIEADRNGVAREMVLSADGLTILKDEVDGESVDDHNASTGGGMGSDDGPDHDMNDDHGDSSDDSSNDDSDSHDGSDDSSDDDTDSHDDSDDSEDDHDDDHDDDSTDDDSDDSSAQ